MEEHFENNNFASRGWYDNTRGQRIDYTEYAPTNGSTKSGIYHFSQHSNTPGSGPAMRRKFKATSEFYVEYWVKYSTGYLGSGTKNHPHELFILSDQDDAYAPPNYSYLQIKIEQNDLHPRIIIRDDRRINTFFGQPPIDLTDVTHNRAVHGCNGGQDNHPVNCYRKNNKWYNSKQFTSITTKISVNTWHKVSVYIKLNTLSDTTSNADGIIQYWLDNQEILSHNDVIMRTNAAPNIKFNQLGIAPYIGVSSPVSQTMWIDELEIYTDEVVQ